MVFQSLGSTQTGIEISQSAVTAVRIERDRGRWRLLGHVQVPFAEDVLNLSYKEKNIVSGRGFAETVGKAVSGLPGRAGRAGVSIPNEIVKISIQKFEALPKTKPEIEKLIAWEMEKTLHFPRESTKIAYHAIDNPAWKHHHLLVTACVAEVLKDYEDHLLKLKLAPLVIRPSGINQFNFFQPVLPEEGVIAFLGLYETFFTFFVYEDTHLTFYHGGKRGFSDLHFFQDVDMTMQHYFNINPEKEIEKLFVGSQVAFHKELADVFRNISRMDVAIIDETQLIESGMDPADPESRNRLSALASAIGAAQSICSERM